MTGHASVEVLSDLCTPWCLHVAVTLRIAEHITRGVDDLDGLAAAAHCDAQVLQSVLRHLVGKGVFVEEAPGRFGLNDSARQLLEPSVRLGLDLGGIGGRMAHAWSTLLTFVETGAPAYRQVFGRPFWEDLDAHPDIAASFDALMGPAGHGAPDPDLLVAGDWDAVRTVVDVGGGTGAMLAAVLRAHAGVHGILVDLPSTVARAAATFDAAGVADRVTMRGQSFFEPLPAGADLYLLLKVLNDWPEDDVVRILRRCADAVGPRGRIVVSGGVSPDGASGGIMIEMVLLGGRTHTLAEFGLLARAAGLDVAAAARQASGRFVVECRRSD